MAPFGLLLLAAASWRPQIKAGYECLKPCDATTRASGRRACEVSDFRWDLLDALQHAGGLRVRGNGSVYWDTSRAAPGYSCDPAESNNQSLFMQHARSQGVKNILSLHPPKPSSPSYNASSEVFQLLANSSTRARAVAAASSMAAAGGFDGLSVDFEGSWTATAAFRGVFSDFVAELAATCSALSPPLTVSSALAHDLAYNTAEDATAQAKASTDGVVIMTYDYHTIRRELPVPAERPHVSRRIHGSGVAEQQCELVGVVHAAAAAGAAGQADSWCSLVRQGGSDDGAIFGREDQRQYDTRQQPRA